MTAHYLTEERLMIQEVARDFTMKEILPVANELDPVQGQIPMDLRRKMGEMGYFGIRMPEKHGGMGLGVFEYCLIAEELARGWMSVASIIARGIFTDVGGRLARSKTPRTYRQSRGWRIPCSGVFVRTPTSAVILQRSVAKRSLMAMNGLSPAINIGVPLLTKQTI